MCSRDGQSKSNKEQFNSSNEHYYLTCTENNGDKNCQAEKNDMQPKKPKKDMWPNRSAMPIPRRKSIKQIVSQEDDKICQVNMKQVKLKVCSDKNCQENINMLPVKPPIHMQSVTGSSNKKLIGLATDKHCHYNMLYKTKEI